MNNNYYNIPNDWYSDMMNNPFMDNFVNYNSNYENNHMDNSSNNINYEEGLDRGNLFDNLYKGYKNYKYRKLRTSNPKEELLYTILKHKFLLNDLNLYLDIYPNNKRYLMEYDKYLNNLNKAMNEYESKYGPLTVDSGYVTKNNTWNWNNNPWPWEVFK